MSQINFEKLYINRFSCIEEAVIPLDTADLCCIEGKVYNEESSTELPEQLHQRSNGAGKSSIVEAFYFCLTGEFFDSDTVLASVINRFSGSPAEVILTGTKEDTDFIIKRSLDAKSKRSKVNHNLEFTIGDQKVHEQTNSISQTQERINEYLGINSLLLLNSKIFGQGDISSFTKVNDRHKKIIIDNLVGVGICDKLCKIAKSTLSEVTTTMTTINIELMGEQNNLERERQEISKLIEKEQNWKTELEKELNGKITYISNLDNKIRSEQNKIVALEVQKSQHNEIPSEQITNLESETEKAQQIQMVITQKIEEVEVKRNELEKTKNYCLGEVSSILTSSKKLTKLYKEGDKKVCPTCMQELSLSSYESIMPQFTKGQEEINTKLEKYETEIKIENATINKYREAKKELEEKLKDIALKIKELRKLVEEEQQVNKEIEKTKIVIEGIEKEKRVIQESLQTVKDKSCPYAEMIEGRKIRTVELEEGIKDKKNQIKDLETEQQYYNFLVKAFDKTGIPQLISSDVLKVLNRILKKYKDKILGEKFEANYEMKQKKNGEEIYLNIINPDGGDGYSRQSKGEKRKIDLCQMFSISDFAQMQNKCNINTTFYDEIFSELDVYSCEIILDIIKNQSVKSKFIVTHKDILKDAFKNKITVEKIGNVSTVKVNY